MYNNLLFIESPVQIVFVLIIALVVFGPKRLPELGKQLGTGLRELNKAKNDLMRSMTLDHEQEPYKETYSYPPSTDTAYSNSYNYNDYSYNAPPDLTDYTIAGQTPQVAAAEHTVARSADIAASESNDYSLNHQAALGPQGETSSSNKDLGVEARKEGETHV